MQSSLAKKGLPYIIGAISRVDRVKTQCTEHIPARHLSAVLIATMSIGGIVVLGAQYLAHSLTGFLRVSGKIVQISYVVTWFVAVHVLPYHTGTKDRQTLIRGRSKGKHRVEFLLESLFASHRLYKSRYIVGYKPTVLPSIALAEIRGVVFWVKRIDKGAFAVSRSEESSARVEKIAPVLGSSGKVVSISAFAQSSRKLSDTPIVISIL